MELSERCPDADETKPVLRRIPLTTSSGDVYHVEFEAGSSLWMFNLMAPNGRRVGYLWANQTGETIRLSDIRIDSAVHYSMPWWRRLLMRLGVTPEPRRDFRGLGLGSALLDCFVAQARAAGLRRIYGGIVENDLKSWPDLPAWYARHGFEVRPKRSEDTDCIGKLFIHRIIR